MSESKRKHILVDKSEEMRTEEISEMIEEGGLGADKYYDVVKTAAKDKGKSNMIDEGGLVSNKNKQEKTIDNFSASPSNEKEEKKKEK